jgi:FkbM family methyltransferase
MSLSFLGRVASTARKAGLQAPFAVVRNLADAFFLGLNFPPLTAGIDGITLHGFLRHRSYLEELSQGTYESASRKLFCRILPSADVFVDGGAHIGLYSLLADRLGCAGLAVLAFEPDPYNQRAFRWNLRANRCRKVNMFPAAVSDTTGSARLVISDGTIGSSLNLERTEIGGTHLLEVKTVALDSVLKDYSCKNLLVKLDIEGAEIRALQGMASTLRNAERVAIICEINPEAIKAGGKTTEDLLARLRDADLQVFFISDAADGLIPVNGPFEAKGNLLAVRDWPIAEEFIRHSPPDPKNLETRAGALALREKPRMGGGMPPQWKSRKSLHPFTG